MPSKTPSNYSRSRSSNAGEFDPDGQILLVGADPRLLNKEWRVDNLYKIKDKNKKVIKFRRNRAQREFNERRTNRNIILKSRQLGITTDEAIDSLDDVLFIPNTDALMLSYDIPSQLDIFDNKINFAWDNLNPSLKALYSLDADRANKLKFNWGDHTTSSISVRSKARGGTFNRLHISEFAKICKESPEYADEIISGNIPSVPLGGRIDIESTAEGDYGHFYEMFWEAYNRGKPITPVDFTAFFFNWTYDDEEIAKVEPMFVTDIPKDFLDYQKKHNLTPQQITYYYYKFLSLNKSYALLKREYPTTPEEAFESSGDKVFNRESLDEMKLRDGEQVGKWTYFADYKPNHRYILAADPAEGVGRDNSAAVVWDFNARPKPEIVATFADPMIAPDIFAHELKAAGTRFGNCMIAVERNNHGHTVLAILKKMYYNLYKERKVDFKEDITTEKLGWHTNMATKPRMVYDFKTAIDEGLVNIPDKITVRELLTYERDDVTTFNREEVKHWDRAIAAMIGWQLRGYATGGVPVTNGGDDDFHFDPHDIVGAL